MNPKDHKSALPAGQAATAESRVFTVPESPDRGRRLDAFLGEVLRGRGLSRERIKRAVLSGLVTVNGAPCAKPGVRVLPGDTVAAAVAPPAESIAPEQGELAVLWRDEHLAVLNKPAGLTVHPAPGRDSGTLAHILLHHFPELAEQGGKRPGIVHRLDKDTSGLLLVALTEKARLAMSEAFAARNVHKRYLALVHGVPEKTAGTVAEPIGRDPTGKTRMAVLPVVKGGREARSDYEVLFAGPGGRFSLVRVAIHSGRTHQIRVHLRHIGHPLVGDAVYKTPNLVPLPGEKGARQMLHAWQLAFTHPMTGEQLGFTLPPPADFASLAASLAVPMQRAVITGSPGSGKSTLTRALRDAGVPVWNADDAVKHLYEKGGDGWYMLLRCYGPRFVPNENKGVDKKALFAAMRDDETLRGEVEHLIHPLARHGLDSFWQTQEERGEPLAAAEIPLVLESGWRGDELLVGVYCPFDVRKKRMAETRGWSEEMIAAMESWQWPENKKVRAASLVVDNSGPLEDMHRRSACLLHVLAFLRSQQEKRAQARLAALWT